MASPPTAHKVTSEGYAATAVWFLAGPRKAAKSGRTRGSAIGDEPLGHVSGRLLIRSRGGLGFATAGLRSRRDMEAEGW